MIVGLSGYAGAGKDEAARALVADGWHRVAFADPIKELGRALGWNGKKDERGRMFLQDLGLDVREIVHPEAWIWAAERRIDGYDGNVVITDVRFQNEVDLIRRRKGLWLRVQRPGVGPANGHVSEHDLKGWTADAVIINDCTIRVLHERTRWVVSLLTSRAQLA